MKLDSRIVVAGAKGMVGSAIVRNLRSKGYTNITEATRIMVDFTCQKETEFFFDHVRPEYVFVAAAKVGGIIGNRDHKAEMIYENLMIQTNIIHYAHKFEVKKLLFLGSSCIYPKVCSLPITEEQLLTGPLEPTNDAYAIAKISGIKMCQSYRDQYGFNAVSVMPCNLYGPGDNYHPVNSHVFPGFIRRFHEAAAENKVSVTCWGDGTPMREFLHVDDLAEACHLVMEKYDGREHLNIGSGEDVTIKELAETIADVVGFIGDIEWDTSKPNGTMRKVMDVSKIKELGWEPKIGLRQGIEHAYESFIQEVA